MRYSAHFLQASTFLAYREIHLNKRVILIAFDKLIFFFCHYCERFRDIYYHVITLFILSYYTYTVPYNLP